MRVYALIPARSGSKGAPDKNVREIAGHPLVAYSIAFAKKIKFERIIVSTDSPKYQNIAVRYGADCPYLRGSKASNDTAMEEDILADLAANLPRFGIDMPDVWVRLKPTSPFRSVRSVEARSTRSTKIRTSHLSELLARRRRDCTSLVKTVSSFHDRRSGIDTDPS